MYDAVKEGMQKEWARVRPNDSLYLLDRLLYDDQMRVFANIAFEAGRRFQVEHPKAAIGVPDYDAPKTFECPEYYEPSAAVTGQ